MRTNRLLPDCWQRPGREARLFFCQAVRSGGLRLLCFPSLLRHVLSCASGFDEPGNLACLPQRRYPIDTLSFLWDNVCKMSKHF